MSIKKPCAYCGKPADKRDREHVFPKNLYPLSKAKSKIQRLTIPACNECNNSWADDEAHFRNMLVLAGDPPTPEKMELWNTTIDRSFSEVDGVKRMGDLLAQMKPGVLNGQERHKIFPVQDSRVVRVVKKIVRGLSYHHELEWPLADERIFVDYSRYEIPENILNEMEYYDRDRDIIEYRFQVLNHEDIQSVWILTFFQTVTFFCFVNTATNQKAG